MVVFHCVATCETNYSIVWCQEEEELEEDYEFEEGHGDGEQPTANEIELKRNV